MEADPAIASRQCAGPRPQHLSRDSQLVEPGLRVVAQSGRQHECLPGGGRKRDSRELLDHLEQSVGAAQAPARVGEDVLPGRQEAAERVLRHRFDLLAKRCERTAAEASKDLRIHPLAARGSGSELALDDATVAGETPQRIQNYGDAEPESPGDGRGGERPVRARIPAHQVADRVGNRLHERGRHPDRQGDTECVAEAARVLDDGPAVVARNPGSQNAVCARQFGQPG